MIMGKKNNPKNRQERSWFLPVFLTICLAILIMLLLLIKELKKAPGFSPLKEFKTAPLIENGRERVGAPDITAVPKGGKPRIALVIDDVGWNREIVREIERINQPFTLALLPEAQYSREIFDSVKNNFTMDVILHLPLEPEPPAQSFDKGLLSTDMGKAEIIEQFNKNIEYYYPYIKGLNSHMGSRFTADEEKMKILMEEIKAKNLFFVDSFTTKKSVGFTLAKEMGVKTGRRDVFIDNFSDRQYIEKQIWELVESARKQGWAIGIGHARKDTIEVLKKVVPLVAEEVEIVPVSALLE